MTLFSLKHKTILIMLFLLTFVSQAMASSIMSYEMTAMQWQDSQSMTQMSSMPNMMHDMSNDETSSDDCCSQSCDCLISGCSTVALVNDIFPQQQVSRVITDFDLLALFIYNQFPKSLYRPPISA